MKKLISLLSIFAIILSCSSDETSTPVTPPPAPIVKYTITLSAGEGGTVSTTGGEYEAGQTVSVTATPQGEYVFTSWSDGNTNPTRTITVSSNSTLTANFEKRKYPLTLNIEGEGEVLEEIVNAGRTTDYDSGTTVKLTAVPAEGWEFVGWTGAIESEELEVQLLVSEAKEVNAEFKKIELASLVLNEKSKMFTKGVADTLLIPINIPGGFKGIKVNSQDGLISIASKPLEGALEGEIVVNYTNQKVNNVNWRRSIAGYDNITFEIEDLLSNTTIIEYKLRTQPEPKHRSYFEASNKSINKSHLRVDIPLIRFLNKKDNKWNGQCNEIENFGYNKYGNLHDGAGAAYAFADINGDGYDDIITSPGDSGMLVNGGYDLPEKYPNIFEIYFYDDGEFIYHQLIEEIEYYNNQYIIPGDFDSDGDVDFYLGNDGIDREPFPGEVNVVIENKFNEYKEFTIHKVQDPKYNHQGAVGDIDNDGDLDIITNQSGSYVGLASGSQILVIFENKGGFIFEEKLNVVDGTNNLNLSSSKIELIDVNRDGNLDIYVGRSIDPTGTCYGMDKEYLNNIGFSSCPNFTSIILLGKGDLTFSFEHYIDIPDVENFNTSGNIICEDLNNDGNNEIIINRNGIKSGDRFATRGYYVQILTYENDSLYDVTNNFIERNYEKGLDEINCWLDAKVNGFDRFNDLDNNGLIDLYNVPQDDFRNFLRWEWNGSKFIKIN
ncbi:VCBS repeat-containing protein [Flavobacteriaceae bacterium]|nr:VCBS repeat-containing protein [Flavobacteriaceae bacterium]